jgi:hypothetical protein
VVGERKWIACKRSVGNAGKVIPAFNEFKSREKRAKGWGQRMVGRGEAVEDANFEVAGAALVLFETDLDESSSRSGDTKMDMEERGVKELHIL